MSTDLYRVRIVVEHNLATYDGKTDQWVTVADWDATDEQPKDERVVSTSLDKLGSLLFATYLEGSTNIEHPAWPEQVEVA